MSAASSSLEHRVDAHRRNSAGCPCARRRPRAPIDSAITLSESFIIWRNRSISGGDCTDAISLPRRADRAALSRWRDRRRSATASARPASSAGVLERAESTLTGWVRPPSSITASIGAMSPPSMSTRIPARRHRRSAEGADVHLHRRRLDTAAPHLVGEVADPRRARVPGVLAGRRRRQRRVAAALEHHDTGLVLVGGHHLGGEPRVAVEGEQRAPRRQHLVRRRRLHRHVGALLPTAAHR